MRCSPGRLFLEAGFLPIVLMAADCLMAVQTSTCPCTTSSSVSCRRL